MWSRSNRNGKFQVQVWNTANELTFEAEFENATEADRAGEEENRKALAPLLGGYTMTATAAITAMQTKRQVRALVWQNANGTFSHHRDAQCEWADEASCRTDLRFHEEWAA